MNHQVRGSALMLVLMACDREVPGTQPLGYDWQTGETFHVAARYRQSAIDSLVGPISLEGGAPEFGTLWSDEIVWTYEVVDGALDASAGTALYDYSLTSDGTAPLAVLRVWLDPSLNDSAALLSQDPITYLVFRADRDRLGAIVQFLTVDGERRVTAWTSGELGPSWSVLSQSALTPVPTYLPPYAAHALDETLILENGSSLSTEVTEAGVDVTFEDELGGGAVVGSYAPGRPWPTLTATSNLEARLLEESEVAARRGDQPIPEPPEPLNYVAELANAVTVDPAVRLDDETMGGGFVAEVDAAYLPWAGSCWPQTTGGVVFGFEGHPTLSTDLHADVDVLRAELDDLAIELGSFQGTDEDRQELLLAYTEASDVLRELVVSYYEAVAMALQTGDLVVDDGVIAHAIEGWTVQVDQLSPTDKFALQLYLSGQTDPNPFFASAWEVMNHYVPGGPEWWGHCSGWASAAVLTEEPRTDVLVALGDTVVQYATADLKALLSETHHTVFGAMIGGRYGLDVDAVDDLTPQAFHALITHQLRDRRRPVVFDVDPGAEVHAAPALEIDVRVTETTSGASEVVNINTDGAAAIAALPSISEADAAAVVRYRETYGPFQRAEDIRRVAGITSATYNRIRSGVTASASTGARRFDVVATATLASGDVEPSHVDSAVPTSTTAVWAYTLETDARGRLLGGNWEDEANRPDFAWIPYDNAIVPDPFENPYLSYGEVLEVFGDSVRRP